MRASETTETDLRQLPHSPQIRCSAKEGEGFIQAMKILDGGRISIAALSLGIAKGAYEASVRYAKERQQFGQAHRQSFQGISFKLADMSMRIEAAELLTRKAGNLKDRGERTTKISAMAKLYASETAVWVANEAVQVHGGYGYVKEFPVEKHYRDAKLCTIGEGTSEIQRLVISREVLRED
jgi:alkylation response protein AidB-like acyl-CoA dehydrogenase